jgi:hypothetical protein
VTPEALWRRLRGPSDFWNPYRGEVEHMEGYSEDLTVPSTYETDLLKVYARYGVGDMVGLEGTEARVVRLSTHSGVVCPMHEFRLVPDACRSCRFLAGEGH